jgi:hypothetical protein
MSIFSPWFFHGWGVAQADREGQDDLVPVALLLLVLASSGWAARLADALGSGTPDDVIAVAQHAGPEELAAAVVGPDAVAARAAAFAAPAVQDGWSMLDELARAAGGWDRGRAVDATRAGLAIARGLDGDAAITADLADDVLAELAASWHELARRADRWADVRVGALEIAARLTRARRATADDDPGLGYDLAAMLADGDPAVRRAAAELVPQPSPPITRSVLGAAVAADADPAVVVAAAQAVCADLGAGDPEAPILGALGAAGIERLREVLGAPGVEALPPGALVDAARCLAADGTPPSRAALHALTARAPRSARAALARIRP